MKQPRCAKAGLYEREVVVDDEVAARGWREHAAAADEFGAPVLCSGCCLQVHMFGKGSGRGFDKDWNTNTAVRCC
jgi:hypothetical protein